MICKLKYARIMCVCVYIYREREREREVNRSWTTNLTLIRDDNPLEIEPIDTLLFYIQPTFLLKKNNKEKNKFFYCLYSFMEILHFGCTYSFGLHPESQQFSQRWCMEIGMLYNLHHSQFTSLTFIKLARKCESFKLYIFYCKRER